MPLSLNHLVAITILPVAAYAALMAGLVFSRAPVSVELLTVCGAVLSIASVGLANFLKYRQERRALAA